MTPSGNRENYGKNWEEKRREVLCRDRFRCQHCGMKNVEQRNKDPQNRSLHVHHIVPIREFEEPEQANILENLITLCQDCHNFWEGNTGYDVNPEELVQEVRR